MLIAAICHIAEAIAEKGAINLLLSFVSLVIKLIVKAQGRAYQAQVGKGLGKIAQMLAVYSQLLCIQPQMIGICQYLFKNKPRFFYLSG